MKQNTLDSYLIELKKTNIVEYLIVKSGLTQKEFALKVGTTEPKLSRYKKIPTSVPYVTVVDWAEKLNINL